MKCPNCSRELEFGDAVYIECDCGSKVGNHGHAMIPCPYCGKRHWTFSSQREKCDQYAELTRIIDEMVAEGGGPSLVGTTESVDMDHDKIWVFLQWRILKRDQHTCQVCGVADDPERCLMNLHVHHIIPRNQAGSDHPRNLITLCEACHRKAHTGRYGYQRPRLDNYTQLKIAE